MELAGAACRSQANRSWADTLADMHLSTAALHSAHRQAEQRSHEQPHRMQQQEQQHQQRPICSSVLAPAAAAGGQGMTLGGSSVGGSLVSTPAHTGTAPDPLALRQYQEAVAWIQIHHSSPSAGSAMNGAAQAACLMKLQQELPVLQDQHSASVLSGPPACVCALLLLSWRVLDPLDRFEQKHQAEVLLGQMQSRGELSQQVGGLCAWGLSLQGV